ncbi:hypothetical protein [Arthrobacter sp. JCM 19049]|uniref:hypothetical protein n=1 Tax=Arthrobacter sp. JCM 19049 TaxID=1460643 RepID=UPI002795E37E|nr:hypothetical protein [Arthrobacter sp. JCM 19049]
MYSTWNRGFFTVCSIISRRRNALSTRFEGRSAGRCFGLYHVGLCTGGSDAPQESGSATQNGGGGGDASTTGLADLGDITTKDDTITVSVGAPEFISYNGFTPQTYSTYNSAITDRLVSGFSYFGTDGKIYANEDLDPTRRSATTR